MPDSGTAGAPGVATGRSSTETDWPGASVAAGVSSLLPQADSENSMTIIRASAITFFFISLTSFI